MKSWIEEFKPKGVVCSPFWRLRHIAACPHACSYCFLNTTYGRFGFPKPITEADLPSMEEAVGKWLAKTKCPTCGDCGWCAFCNGPGHGPVQSDVSRGICPTCKGSGGVILNAGELSDSFAPEISAQASLRLIELFRRQDRHTLLLVTKSNQVAEILKDVEPTKQVILSFSVGHDVFECRERYLPIAPCPGWKNINKVIGFGWRVRLRFDPLLPGLEDPFFEYPSEFIYLRDNLLPVERITLGSLRANTAHYLYLKNGDEMQRALAALLVKDQDGGSHLYRLPFEQRIAIYRNAIQDLSHLTYEIGLCKETLKIFTALGRNPANNLCNCAP